MSLSLHWDQHLYCPLTELTDCSLYKKMLAKIFLLKDMWRHREPKVIFDFEIFSQKNNRGLNVFTKECKVIPSIIFF